jgi:6-phosphogluconolactonase
LAALVVAEARRVTKQSGLFAIALSGGSTPVAAYRALAREPHLHAMPWASTQVFWGDERCVPADDDRSNQRMAREALVDHVPLPAGQVHPIEVEDAAPGRAGSSTAVAVRAAERYERLLRARFADWSQSGSGGGPPGLDLLLLGVGRDGHTASLFPGSDAVLEQKRWVATSLPGDPAQAGQGENVWRVTLTLPFINRASLVVFLAQGLSKAEIVRDVMESPTETGLELPARLVRPASGRVLWLVDGAAASLLGEDEGLARGGAGCSTVKEVRP